MSLNDLIYLNKYKTNGIFSAIENAVIFLFAVTPLSSPELINPKEFIISNASFINTIDSIEKIEVIITENNLLVCLTLLKRIAIFMSIKKTLNCLEKFTITST